MPASWPRAALRRTARLRAGTKEAAGLWAAACIGLAIGIGYYGGAIIGCAMMILVMSVLHNVDERVRAVTPVLDLDTTLMDTLQTVGGVRSVEEM